MAGINCHNKLNEKEPFILGREEAYIGVLIDDLVTKGTDEPYRMFTSRAEYRILLRQDNADQRLTQTGRNIGLINDDDWAQFSSKQEHLKNINHHLHHESAEPSEINSALEQKQSAPLKQKTRWHQVLSRPQVKLEDMVQTSPSLSALFSETPTHWLEHIETGIKYKGYIEKEQAQAERMRTMQDLELPQDMEYERMTSLSTEARQKLSEKRPHTLGAASKISGVSASDVAVLMVYLGR